MNDQPELLDGFQRALESSNLEYEPQTATARISKAPPGMLQARAAHWESHQEIGMRRAWPHVTCSAFGRCCTICVRCWKRSRICSRSSCSTCQRRAPPRGTSTSSHRSDRLRALRSAQWARAAHGHIQRRPIHYSWCSRQRAVRAASRTRLEQRRAHRVSLLRRRRARDRRAVCAARGLRRAARRCRHLQMLRLAMWPLRCVAPRRAARALHSELGRAPRTACLTASPGPSGESASAPSCPASATARSAATRSASRRYRSTPMPAPSGWRSAPEQFRHERQASRPH